VLLLSEKNMSDVGVEITGIPLTNDPNYTHVILFRNDVTGGGDILWPLKLDSTHGGTASIEGVITNAIGLIKNNLVGTVTYRDNQPDSERGRVVGDFPAPTGNDPPPTDIRFMEFWDGRVWYTTIAAPWRLGYSRFTNPDILGVGEESFPALNSIDISANDGLITGMRVVGDSLIVCTDRFMYAVAGLGEGAYRLDRVSARGGGVGHFSLADHPGDTTTNTSSMLYVSRDKRFWRHYPGGRLEDLGAPIQDKLNSADFAFSKPYIVTVFQVEKHWFCAVGIRVATRYDFYFFDFDTVAWMDFGFAGGVTNVLSISSAVFFPPGTPEARLGSTAGQTTYPLMQDSGSPVTTAKLTTQILDMGDVNQKKTLQEIVYYVSDATYTGHGCKARLDGTSAAYTALTKYDPVSTPRFRGPGIVRWNASALGPAQWSALQLEIELGTVFSATVQKIHKVEVVYSVASTGRSGRPSG
ncbi:MAG: hypothetical protein ACREEM_55955, partial [Blastocatellia bacterium]